MKIKTISYKTEIEYLEVFFKKLLKSRQLPQEASVELNKFKFEYTEVTKFNINKIDNSAKEKKTLPNI